jgi:tetrahydromethanopterin S-methyltransferase subunit G
MQSAHPRDIGLLLLVVGLFLILFAVAVVVPGSTQLR